MERLTASGRALFWIGLVVASASSVTLSVKFYFLFSTLISLALVSLMLARIARVPLQVKLSMSDRATCGGRLPVHLSLFNPARRAALDVALRLDTPSPQLRQSKIALSWLPGGTRLELAAELELLRRGHYAIGGVRQETHFPFGVWRDVLLHRQPRSLLVYPRFQPLADLDIPVGRLYQPGGIALSSKVGDSMEFLGTREFQPGDSIRDIHWKSWGRVGKPVVKEFQEEFFCRIALLLDTFVPPASGESFRGDFEASLSLAAAVADNLSHSEYIVDLFAAGPDLYTLQAGRNLAHLDNVLDVLACLEPCREPPFETVTPVLAEHLGNITTVILILLDWDQARERLVHLILDHGPAVKIVLVRETPASLDPAGAEDLLGEVTVLAPEDVERGVDRL
ncbi:MAG: DUF58 domain-containing protein [Armatimonadetes bacterium]|nr:DUF58 domain-containing protein [Armatimonadota bacterium]